MGNWNRLTAVLAGAVGIVVVATTLTGGKQTPVVIPTYVQPPPAGYDLNQALLAAANVDGVDETRRIGLLMGADVACPDCAPTARAELAEALLPSLSPLTATRAEAIHPDRPVTYSAASGDLEVVVTDDEVWETQTVLGPSLTRVKSLGAPVLAFTVGAKDSFGTRVILASGAATVSFEVGGGGAYGTRTLTGVVDTVAVAGSTALTSVGTAGSVWSVGALNPGLVTTFTLDAPATTLVLADPTGSGEALVALAGHADGSVSRYSLDLPGNTATTQLLPGDGRGGSVNAIAADGSTVVAADEGGALTVWSTDTDPITGTRLGTTEPGAHRLWIDPGGLFLLVAAPTGLTVWPLSGADTTGTIVSIGANTFTTPPMITTAGDRAATISGDTLTFWDLSPLSSLIANPVPRACVVTGMTDAGWVALDIGLPNPCPRAASPGLNQKGS